MHFELFFQASCLQLSNIPEIPSPAAKLPACFLSL